MMVLATKFWKILDAGLIFVTSEKWHPEPKALENFQYL